MGFREACNASGPIRWVTGRHDLSCKTPPDKLEVSSRENPKYMAGGFRVEMSADRHDRTRAVTTRLAKRHPTNRKSVCGSLRRISLLVFREGRNVAGPTPSDTGRQDLSSKTRPDKAEVSSRETPKCMGGGFQKG